MVRNLKVVNTEKNDTENEFSVSLCLQSELCRNFYTAFYCLKSMIFKQSVFLLSYLSWISPWIS